MRISRLGVVALAAILAVLAPACSSETDEPKASEQAQSGDGGTLTLTAAKPIPLEPLGGRQASAVNVIVNGGFEEAADGGALPGWQGLTTAAGLYGEPVEGERCLRIEAGPEPIVVTQNVSVFRGGKYWLRGHLRTENLSGEARLSIEAIKGAKLFSAAAPPASGTTWWTAKSIEFESPVDALVVRLEVPASAAGGGMVWADEIGLFQIDAPAGAANLLVNASFEATPDAASGWRVPAGVKAQRSTDAVDGEASLQLDTTNTTNVDVYQLVTVTPGATYVMDGMVKTENVAGNVQLEVRDGQRGWRGFMHSGEPVTGTVEWRHLETTFTVPAGTTSLMVYLRRPTPKEGNPGAARMWFDAYRLRPASGEGK